MRSASLLLLLAAAPLLVAPIAAAEVGEQLFIDSCSGCHQVGGIGQSGLAPPLVDPALWAGLGGKSPDYLVGVMLGGLTGKINALGEDYVGLAMPSQDWMTDEEMLQVADYVLHDLNGLDLTASADLIAATRAARPSHAQLRAIRKEAIP